MQRRKPRNKSLRWSKASNMREIESNDLWANIYFYSILMNKPKAFGFEKVWLSLWAICVWVIVCNTCLYIIQHTLRRFHSKSCISCEKSLSTTFFSTFLRITSNCHVRVLKWSRVPSGFQRVVFEPYWHPYEFSRKKFFDFKMTYFKLF